MTDPVRAAPRGAAPADDARLRVLLVDDEPNVLSGLRRMLHTERSRWDITLATGPVEALGLVAEGIYDVVVSDMRMPGMDGAELLVHVRQRCPTAMRVVLSGQSDRAAAIRAAGVAHQFVDKPVRPADLIGVVERRRDLRRLGPELIAALAPVDGLAAPEATLRRLGEALGAVSVDVDEICGLVASDLSISCKVLQLVHSSFFAPPHRVTGVSDAVTYLGVDNLRDLLASGVVPSLPGPTDPDRLAARIPPRSALALRLAHHILPDPAATEDLVLGTLLDDVGLVATQSLAPDAWETLGAAGGAWTAELEREVLGATHGEVGACLLGLWGLPVATVDLVARHADPGPPPDGRLHAVHAVHLAGRLLAEIDPLPGHDGLDGRHARALGVEAEVPGWRRHRDDLVGSLR